VIPYVEWRVIQLGPLTLQVWGLFAALGTVAGAWWALREAKKRGLDLPAFETLILNIVIWAFIGARIVHAVFYEPAHYLTHPLDILKVWQGGLSSFGGFIGAAGAFFWAMRTKKMPLLPAADTLVSALPLALGCGRIGCFLIHDHPGTLAHGAGKWFAVNYPDALRYDLGLLLAVFDFAFFSCLVFSQVRKNKPDGFTFALFMTVYAPVRFGLDFLRAVDVRYFGLTPGQYGSIALFASGLYLFRRIKPIERRPDAAADRSRPLPPL
jgi:phosphatidylglycerol:prolipoprotein diacylglycerol transferase